MSHQQMTQHPRGGGRDDAVQHACPDCPSPLAAGLTIAPNPFCPHCAGTGLLTTDQLARWQRETLARAGAA